MKEVVVETRRPGCLLPIRAVDFFGGDGVNAARPAVTRKVRVQVLPPPKYSAPIFPGAKGGQTLHAERYIMK